MSSISIIALRFACGVAVHGAGNNNKPIRYDWTSARLPKVRDKKEGNVWRKSSRKSVKRKYVVLIFVQGDNRAQCLSLADKLSHT